MAENKILMTMARQTLNGKWGQTAIATLIYLLIEGSIYFATGTKDHSRPSPLGNIVLVLITGPLAIGFIFYFMQLTHGKETSIADIFNGFKRYGRSLGTYLLVGIFTLLWLLLFIIPGIIKSFSYSMTFYILNEDPNVTPNEAINRSMEMMKGHKWKLFCLSLRFLGWIILGCLTLGIGFLWIVPYMQVSMILFYEDIKPKTIAEEEVTIIGTTE